MQFEFASLAIGILAGSLITVAIAVPRAGRIFAQLASVVLMMGGIGLLSLGIVALATGGEFTPVVREQITIDQPVEAIGVGGGLLAGSILALVLSFLGGNKRVESSDSNGQRAG